MNKKKFIRHKEKIIILTKGNICRTKKELLKTTIFKKILLLYLEFLRQKDSPLLGIIPEEYKNNKKKYSEKILTLLQLLVEKNNCVVKAENKELEGFFKDTYLLNQFVEELYNYWRNYERFLILLSGKDKDYHEKPYRSFKNIFEHLTDLVRGSYRDICENITNKHPRVYRQVSAGFQVGIIASKPKLNIPVIYNKLKNISYIRQVLIEPPLIINPPMNKRSGSFKEIKENIFQQLDIKPEEWLCFPAKVGELNIQVFFHYEFIALGTALANLFDLAEEKDLNKKPDAIYLFGVDEEDIKRFGEPQTIFYDDKENDLMIGFVSRKEEYGYFGYLKKMILTLHNIICLKKGRLPVHGAMVKILFKNGKKRNIVIIGDTGTGKSESIEAFRALSQEHIRDLTIIFDDMGSFDIKDGQLKAYGTETGAFVRLDDMHPGFVYGNLDRSIITSPDKVNARAVLPITTMKEVTEGQIVDMVLYANNYENVKDCKHIKEFRNWKEAFKIFKEGKRMAKGTTTESGMTSSYFANPFGPPQYKELHEVLAKKYFEHFFEKNIFVGEIKTMLGIPGYEKKGPEKAAKELFKFINVK
ncbi:MAG: phosphoenolpyruvate carboxykinase [Nanoarchaeota archaeon]|nr:phosphoenolpyruvate carboxykinase [Nanoarchaeota archaeon]